MRHYLVHANKGDFDAGVKDTVEAVKQILDKNAMPAEAPEGTVHTSSGPTMTPEESRALANIVLYGLLGLLVVGGATFGAIKTNNWRKRVQQDVETVNASLKQMGSSYEAGFLSVYSLKTVGALLSAPSSTVDVKQLAKALSVVKAKLPETQDAAYRQLLIDKGLNQATPTVREYAVK